MKFFLLNGIFFATIISISAYQPSFNYDAYAEAQNGKLLQMINTNKFFTERFEKNNRKQLILADLDQKKTDYDYDKLMLLTTSSASPSTTTTTTVTTTTLESNQSDETVLDKDDLNKNTTALNDDKAEEKEEDNLGVNTDNEKYDYYSDKNNETKTQEYELINRLSNRKYEKINEEEMQTDDNDDEDENEDDDTQDFDYTTQNYDLDDDSEEKDDGEDQDEDDDENESKNENENSEQTENIFQNILDLIQLDKLINSFGDLFKQSTPVESSLPEKYQEPTKKKKNLILILVSNKNKPNKSLQGKSSDYEPKALIRSAASKSTKECSNEGYLNIMRSITKISLFLASVSLCVLILLTLLRFCLIRKKNNNVSLNGYDKLENIDTILQKI